jgi:hypothetical protein
MPSRAIAIVNEHRLAFVIDVILVGRDVPYRLFVNEIKEAAILKSEQAVVEERALHDEEMVRAEVSSAIIVIESSTIKVTTFASMIMGAVSASWRVGSVFCAASLRATVPAVTSVSGVLGEGRSCESKCCE